MLCAKATNVPANLYKQKTKHAHTRTHTHTTKQNKIKAKHYKPDHGVDFLMPGRMFQVLFDVI